MSETLESWKKQNMIYQKLIAKSGHAAAQMRSHEKTLAEVNVELDAVVKKVSSLENHLTKEDMEWIANQQRTEGASSEPTQEVKSDAITQ